MLTTVSISKSALLHNARALASTFEASFFAVVKSNAYGHGVSQVASILAKENTVRGFAVISTTEALALRKILPKRRILVLSYIEPEILSLAIKQGIELTIIDPAQFALVVRAARQAKKKAIVHLKLDTGAGRVGVDPAAAFMFIKRGYNIPEIVVRGVMSHFSDAEEHKQYTELQLARFLHVRTSVDASGLRIPEWHIAASAAGILWSSTRLSFVRAGIAMYGLWPSAIVARNAPSTLNLKPALTWQTSVIQVREHPKNTPISYGRTYVTKKKSKIAVLPIGYRDGFPRDLSNLGEVLIGGRRCPVRGRVCMNLTMVDISRVPKVRRGDVVMLIGRQGRQIISTDDFAKKRGTINYEAITAIPEHIPRVICD
jgi:alanine racemase